MTHATSRSKRLQLKSVNRYRQNNHYLDVFNLITSDTLFDRIEALLPKHRERLFPPTETLSMFVAQALSADQSCQNVLNQAAIQRLTSGLPTCSTQTGGYCRARQRLPLKMIQSLTTYLGDQLHQQTLTAWRWNGHQVKVVDGTTVSMPDTPLNQENYPQQGGQSPGLGFPICRVVGITCLASGALLDAAIGRYKGKGADELTLLRSIQTNFQTGDVILADALYATYFLIAELQASGVDVLMEQNGRRKLSTDFRRGQRLGAKDHVIELSKPKVKPQWMSAEHYQIAPESIRLRELKAGGKVLVTTMTCARTYPKDALKQLYQKRWSVELDIRDIKTTMGMDVLSCKTPEMVLKEIWVHFLAYNLIRLVMMQSALLVGILPRSISFKHTLQLWLSSIQRLDVIDQNQREAILRMIGQQQIGRRPGRIEPRAVKRRPKQTRFLTKPRAQARQELQAIYFARAA